MTTPVSLERRGSIGLLVIDREDRRNSLSRDTLFALGRLGRELVSDPDVRAIVLTGRGDKAFCAGADLKAINAGLSDKLMTARGGFAGIVYRERKKPIIVAVDGLATAGGCEIVLSADLVVMSTRSSFGLAEVKRNLIAGAGGLFRLPRAIGRAAAMEAILTGDPIPAQRAYELGLASRLCEPGKSLEVALELAAKICTSAPMAVWESRRIVLAADYEDDATLIKMTDEAFGRILKSEDTKEGLAAFIEKRAPKWQGK